MRHRIGGLENFSMGLGADDIPYELDNSWGENKELNAVIDNMFDEALITVFKEIGYFDYKVVGDKTKFIIMFGYEPAYKHEPYLMCCITSNYKDSYIEKGEATDFYGKGVKLDSHKVVVDEDCDKDFVNFVDEWFPKLCETLTLREI